MLNTIDIRKKNIVDLETDCIVNAANSGLAAGGGVCGAIFSAAGYNRMTNACKAIGHCSTGNAVITPGFDLKAKYVIHAVGPVWKDGEHGEEELLKSTYRSSLELAVKSGCRSIGFPLISSGVYGYPVDKAWETALSACWEYMTEYPDAGLYIVFAVISEDVYRKGRSTLRRNPYSRFAVATKEDWKLKDMPIKNEKFIFQRVFTADDMFNLSRGYIPEAMEDKWFFYMENDTWYAHRSWTGICIYIVAFNKDGKHLVTVNRDDSQYKCKDVNEDGKRLNTLLNIASHHRGYYQAWPIDVYYSLKKAGKIPDILRIGDREVNAYYFHKPEEPNGFLSNWYLSSFELDGMHYSSAEQYIMYQKCILFGDEATAKKVLATDDVAEQQKLGRIASGYVDKVWEGMRQIVALKALKAKFSQNDELKKKLLDTEDAFLVECAWSDQIWTCGIGLDDDRRKDTSSWRGMNILGSTLMLVRSELRAMESGTDKE